MDFIRKFLGLKGPSELQAFPENDGGNQRAEHPDYTPFTFSFFNEFNSEFGQSPSDHNDGCYQEHDFENSFRQIEQMMDAFQRIMSGFDFKEPGGYPPIMPPSHNSPDTSQNLTPRDRFLKTPDSHLPPTPRNDEDVRGDSAVMPRTHQFYPDHSEFGFGGVFRMMDELMKPFFTDDFFRPGEGFSGPSIDKPNDAELHPQVPREALLKQDEDLDKQPTQELQELLKEGPGYSAGGSDARQLQTPTVHSNFTSTSISRTVRPDGVIEERRTYRDSTGREEVTVTELDPATAQSLVPNPFGRDGGGLPSFFGRIF